MGISWEFSIKFWKRCLANVYLVAGYTEIKWYFILRYELILKLQFFNLNVQPSSNVVFSKNTYFDTCRKFCHFRPPRLLRQIKKYLHTIFIIYFNNVRDLTIISFFNIVPVLYNALVPAFQKLLDALRKKCLWLSSKPLMHRFLHSFVWGESTAP